MEITTEKKVITSGPAIAAFLAAAIGCAVIGIAAVATVISPWLKDHLNWWNPAGPLTGKTGVGILAWLLSWPGLHFALRHREPKNKRVWIIVALVLVAIGFIGTFPPVYEAFDK